MEPSPPAESMLDHRPPQPFYVVWIKALFVPTESTYAEILADPTFTVGRGALWVFAASLISQIILACVVAAFYSVIIAALGLEDTDAQTVAGGIGVILIFALCSALLTSAVMVVLGLGNAWLGNALARAMGGVGDFRQHYHAVAAHSAPYQPFMVVLTAIPYLNYCFVPLLLFYGIFLNIRAVKSVHQLSWGKSILASPSVWLGGLEIICCVAFYFVVFVLALIPTNGQTSF